jgi:hypothetical protein
MGKWQTAKGVLKLMFEMIAEDFHEMDHKLIRIVGGIIIFIIMAWFWFTFFRSISPI